MIEYVAGKTKGATTNGDLFNNPFKLGGVDPEYTSDRVTEVSVDGVNKLAWTPVVKGAFEVQVGTSTVKYDVKVINQAGAVEYHNVADDGVTVEGVTSAGFKMAYQYNNIVVPQNDLPTLRAEMKSIALVARARRIAVYFSQIAAFQAKTDYGLTLYAA